MVSICVRVTFVLLITLSLKYVYTCRVFPTRNGLTWVVCLKAKDGYPIAGHSDRILEHGVYKVSRQKGVSTIQFMYACQGGGFIQLRDTHHVETISV